MNLKPPKFRHTYLDLRPLVIQLNLETAPSQLLGWGVFEPKWWRNYLHSHSFFEVCFAFQGRGTFQINGKNHVVKKNDLFLARPGEVHEIVSDVDEPLGIFFWSFTLPTTVNRLSPAQPVTGLMPLFLQSEAAVISTQTIEPVLRLITSELNKLQAGFIPAVQGLSCKLIVDVMRLFSDQGGDIGIEHSTADTQLLAIKHGFVADVIQFLHDNYHLSIRVRDVAAQIHLSERHANRQFKEAVGRPIMTYLTEIRIEKAKALLLNPKLPIGEVAMLIGIDDQRYFASLFKKHVGHSPTAYRQEKGTAYV